MTVEKKIEWVLRIITSRKLVDMEVTCCGLGSKDEINVDYKRSSVYTRDHKEYWKSGGSYEYTVRFFGGHKVWWTEYEALDVHPLPKDLLDEIQFELLELDRNYSL